jgi:hypothetical protein
MLPRRQIMKWSSQTTTTFWSSESAVHARLLRWGKGAQQQQVLLTGQTQHDPLVLQEQQRLLRQLNRNKSEVLIVYENIVFVCFKIEDC